ncbi:hypothetical protein [uncultured Phocaeicola sp.]|uniref:hypothetical protein n=1 Tax=uncultured Phocaeicola sp. TaxID=990718 RepID=UPI0025F04E71|nr:hypothetical protein [uncultured Phocaeicola sp.]
MIDGKSPKNIRQTAHVGRYRIHPGNFRMNVCGLLRIRFLRGQEREVHTPGYFFADQWSCPKSGGNGFASVIGYNCTFNTISNRHAVRLVIVTLYD